MKKSFYNPAIEEQMRLHYSRLLEKDRRHYAAIEATKLGHRGKQYIMRVLGLAPKTLYLGLSELNNPSKYAKIPRGR